jgi:hypothetical protein
MRFSTCLLVSTGIFFLKTVSVKAQVNPNIWTDSVATRRALADTSMVSPFMPLGATKHDEKVAAIKAYCDCEAIPFTERKDRFEALRKKWPYLVRSWDILSAKDYIEGGADWQGEGLFTPVRFEFSPLVKPLVHAPQLAELERGKEGVIRGTLYRNSGQFTCREQVRIMYPAYVPANSRSVLDAYPEAFEELVRQNNSYKRFFHATIEPWLDSVYKKPSTVAHVDERNQSSNTSVTPPKGQASRTASISAALPVIEMSKEQFEATRKKLYDQFCSCELTYHNEMTQSLRFLLSQANLRTLRDVLDVVDVKNGYVYPGKLRYHSSQLTYLLTTRDKNPLSEASLALLRGSGPTKKVLDCRARVKQSSEFVQVHKIDRFFDYAANMTDKYERERDNYEIQFRETLSKVLDINTGQIRK